MVCYKHGEHGTRLYKIWSGMKRRCTGIKDAGYKHYGGRGISMCPEWFNKKTGYLAFRDWAVENGYEDNLTIDRKDVNGNYCPENCKFSTVEEQNSNKRNTKHVVIFGQRYKLKEAHSKFSVVSVATIKLRLRQGWSDEYAVILPSIRHCYFNISGNMQNSEFSVFGETESLSVLVAKYAVVDLSVVRKRINRGWHILYALLLPKLNKSLVGKYSNLGESIDFKSDPLEVV